jgi:uncharacterized membrane protein/protein-disulfide isomerase
MNTSNKLKLAFVIVLIAVGVHAYLAGHYYDLNFGISGSESVCNISSKINCDTVTASPYSAVMGVPIALFGAATNAILGLLILIWLFGWSDDLGRVGRYTLLLSGFTALTSLVMGSISTFLIGSYCLFCMSEYLMSFIIFGLVYSARDTDSKSTGHYLGELAGTAKSYLLFIAAIPVSAFLFHQAILEHLDAKELPMIVHSSVVDWQAAPEMQMTGTPSFVEGAANNAKMVISEFADFRCPHCRHASTPIKAFVSSHSDVQLRFYTFPLDGVCNEAIPGGDGISCFLAKAVYCSEKLGQKGSELHDNIYGNQDDFLNNPSMSYAKDRVGGFLKTFGMKADDVWACVDNGDTDKAIREEAKFATSLGVRATPTLFVNGHQLMRGQLIPVLDAVHAAIK